MLSTRLARLTGKEIEDVCNCDHTTASRIASGQRGATVGQFCELLELMGLKVVPNDKLCVSRDQFEFMRRTTARAMANEQVAAMLFEDPE